MSVYAKQMMRFGECNHGAIAAYQPGQFIDVYIEDGLLVVEIDCYSATHPDQCSTDFDVEKWDAEKLLLEQVPGAPARDAWRAAFQLSRAFIRGRTIKAALDSESINMTSHLASVRQA